MDQILSSILGPLNPADNMTVVNCTLEPQHLHNLPKETRPYATFVQLGSQATKFVLFIGRISVLGDLLKIYPAMIPVQGCRRHAQPFNLPLSLLTIPNHLSQR
jgi:hypothetical protein